MLQNDKALIVLPKPWHIDEVKSGQLPEVSKLISDLESMWYAVFVLAQSEGFGCQHYDRIVWLADSDSLSRKEFEDVFNRLTMRLKAVGKSDFSILSFYNVLERGGHDIVSR